MSGTIDHRLRRNLVGTYLAVRWGLVVLAFSLPFVLSVGAAALDGTTLQGSISDYYYTDMQNVFVGALAAVGALLMTYRGFSWKEDWALNLACVFIVVVALVPTTPPGTASESSGGLVRMIADFLTVHATAAVLFFACLAYVALGLAGETLSLIRPDPSLPWNRTAAFFRRCYRGIGVVMIASPLLAVLVGFRTRTSTGGSTVVFWLESFGVWSFMAYWLVKSREMKQTCAEQLAEAGALVSVKGPGGERRIVQIEPETVQGLSAAEMQDLEAWVKPSAAL